MYPCWSGTVQTRRRMATAARLSIAYFKRFQMEIDLYEAPPSPGCPGIFLGALGRSLVEMHAEVKFQCFHEEIDATVFPSLGSRPGCSYLMSEIMPQDRLPARGDLAGGLYRPAIAGPSRGCASVPAWAPSRTWASPPCTIAAGHRPALLLRALHGFRRRAGARLPGSHRPE